MMLKLSDIAVCNDIQPRVQMDWLVTSEYAADMRAGAEFPPVVVFHDGAAYWLADGFHRVIAARDYAGLTEFQAEVRPGDKRDAWLYALGANKDLGLRLTNADKKKIVEAMLGDAEWVTWSDYEIAAHCGVGHTMVNRSRESIYTISTDSQPAHRKPATRKARRKGKTYTIDIERIGKRKEQPQPAEATQEPQAELYEDVEPEQTPEPTPPALGNVEIINADAQRLSNKSVTNKFVTEPVHLVITSPPYNVGVDYDVYVDNLDTYIPFLTAVWRECYKVMVDGARIAVVVPFGIGRNPYIPFDCQIMQTLVDAGFTLRGRIIWDKNTTGNRTSWGSFRLSSDPSLRDTTEAVIIAHKGQSKLELPEETKQRDSKGTHTAWLADSDYFMSLAQDHWEIPPESAQRVKHPAPFPVELVKRLAHLYAFPGAHILDPFAGSGSVGVAAQGIGCNATLIEISPAYCELAKERLKQ